MKILVCRLSIPQHACGKHGKFADERTLLRLYTKNCASIFKFQYLEGRSSSKHHIPVFYLLPTINSSVNEAMRYAVCSCMLTLYLILNRC